MHIEERRSTVYDQPGRTEIRSLATKLSAVHGSTSCMRLICAMLASAEIHAGKMQYMLDDRTISTCRRRPRAPPLWLSCKGLARKSRTALPEASANNAIYPDLAEPHSFATNDTIALSAIATPSTVSNI
jgi:hypothetical protein